MTDIVWFKRDLRVNDHEPLYRASKNNKIIPLYIVEKNFWKQPDVSDRHYKFLTDSIEDLNSALHDLGQKLIIRVGDAEQIFSELIEKYEGGELVLFRAKEIICGEFNKPGSAIIFPSFINHKVTKVVSGKRHTLAIWLSGPKFR